MNETTNALLTALRTVLHGNAFVPHKKLLKALDIMFYSVTKETLSGQGDASVPLDYLKDHANTLGWELFFELITEATIHAKVKTPSGVVFQYIPITVFPFYFLREGREMPELLFSRRLFELQYNGTIIEGMKKHGTVVSPTEEYISRTTQLLPASWVPEQSRGRDVDFWWRGFRIQTDSFFVSSMPVCTGNVDLEVVDAAKLDCDPFRALKNRKEVFPKTHKYIQLPDPYQALALLGGCSMRHDRLLPYQLRDVGSPPDGSSEDRLYNSFTVDPRLSPPTEVKDASSLCIVSSNGVGTSLYNYIGDLDLPLSRGEEYARLFKLGRSFGETPYDFETADDNHLDFDGWIEPDYTACLTKIHRRMATVYKYRYPLRGKRTAVERFCVGHKSACHYVLSQYSVLNPKTK